MLELETRETRGNGADDEVPKEPAVLTRRIAAAAESGSGGKHLHPRPPEVEQDGKERSDMQSHVKSQPWVSPPQQPGKKGQVRSARNGQEFREALHDSQNNRLVKRHANSNFGF